MEQAAALAAIGFLASKIIELVKYLKNKDWNGFVTLVSMWIAGVVVTVLAAVAEVTEALVLPGTSVPLGVLDGPSLVFLGATLSSVVSFAYDAKKAVDRSDSAKQPPLLGSVE